MTTNSVDRRATKNGEFARKDKQAFESKVDERLAKLSEYADDRTDRRLSKLVTSVAQRDARGQAVLAGEPADPEGATYFHIDMRGGLLDVSTHNMMLVQDSKGVHVSAFSSVGHRVDRTIPDDSPVHRALARVGGLDRRSPAPQSPKERAQAELAAARADEAHWQAEKRAGSARAATELRRVEQRLSRAEDALWGLDGEASSEPVAKPNSDPVAADARRRLAQLKQEEQEEQSLEL